MLPGLPIVVIGNVNTGGDRSLAWGITMASFADVQDLVALEPATVAKARKVPETFRFRDPRTGLLSEESVVDEWTDFGPRVDSFVAGGEGRPLSLDWLGYRRTPSTMDFFVQRNLHGARDLREDLSERWSYPAVNFFWVERSGSEPTVSGHAVTGLLFDRARSGERRPISEREARGRRLSQPSERPWLEKKADGEAFFVVSGNQRVWTGELSRRTASEWYDGARAGAILADFKKAVVKPEASQTDFRSPSLLRFTREARKAVSSDRLCAEMGSQLMVACQRLLSALDSWDGALEVDDWVPSVAAGWYARTKAELWPADRRKLDEDTSAAFQAWHRSNSSNRALLALFSDASKWEKTTGRNFRDVLVDSYRANLNALMNERGPLTEQWSWGGVHRLAWQHPAALAPEPLGTYLRDGLLGPAPIVPGGLDSPGRFDFTWSPDKPLEFPARHGAVMRFCATPLGGGKTRVRWSSVTGASGNPFSDWSKKLAEDSYFKGLLHELKDN
jgi:acyl-homoserine lactone acylase PvdQ